MLSTLGSESVRIRCKYQWPRQCIVKCVITIAIIIIIMIHVMSFLIVVDDNDDDIAM